MYNVQNINNCYAYDVSRLERNEKYDRNNNMKHWSSVVILLLFNIIHNNNYYC